MGTIKKLGLALTLVSLVSCSAENKNIPIEDNSSRKSFSEWEGEYFKNRFATFNGQSSPYHMHLGKITDSGLDDGGMSLVKFPNGEALCKSTYTNLDTVVCWTYDLPPTGLGDADKLKEDCKKFSGCDLRVLREDYTTLTGKTAPF